jgi:hypothetical protein
MGCQAGTEIGAGIGLTLLIILWFILFVVFGLIWIMSKPAKRLCPRCGHDVKKGLTVCQSCNFDFAATMPQPSRAAQPPGWYPDATGQQRWWDWHQLDRTNPSHVLIAQQKRHRGCEFADQLFDCLCRQHWESIGRRRARPWRSVRRDHAEAIAAVPSSTAPAELDVTEDEDEDERNDILSDGLEVGATGLPWALSLEDDGWQARP